MHLLLCLKKKKIRYVIVSKKKKLDQFLLSKKKCFFWDRKFRYVFLMRKFSLVETQKNQNSF